MSIYGRRSYKDMHKLEHTGKLQHRNRGKGGNNIVVHVLTHLDDSAEYREVDGRLMVKDANILNGQHTVEKEFITIGEHNRKHYPILQNPLNEINKEELKRINFNGGI